MDKAKTGGKIGRTTQNSSKTTPTQPFTSSLQIKTTTTMASSSETHTMLQQIQQQLQAQETTFKNNFEQQETTSKNNFEQIQQQLQAQETTFTQQLQQQKTDLGAKQQTQREYHNIRNPNRKTRSIVVTERTTDTNYPISNKWKPNPNGCRSNSQARSAPN